LPFVPVQPAAGLHGPEKSTPFSMSVRIEISLPVTTDQAVYDKIFKSIKENLMNG